jgi:hypothetical protein
VSCAREHQGREATTPFEIPEALLRRQCAGPGLEWLDRTLAALAPPLDRGAFAAAFAACGRRLGAAPVVVSEPERITLAGARQPRLAGRPLADAGRLVLLLRALACLEPAEHATFVDGVYRRGDTRERQALLATLAALPEPVRFVATAVEACRTNVLPEFEAIACDNPYPADHFSDLQFNQMVLKALFVGVSLARVEGLERRAGPELARMVDDFARERRAAGRPVPPDVTLVRTRP